jgi:hypothetical protein
LAPGVAAGGPIVPCQHDGDSQGSNAAVVSVIKQLMEKGIARRSPPRLLFIPLAPGVAAGGPIVPCQHDGDSQGSNTAVVSVIKQLMEKGHSLLGIIGCNTAGGSLPYLPEVRHEMWIDHARILLQVNISRAIK